MIERIKFKKAKRVIHELQDMNKLKFYELEITIRAGDIDTIKGLLPQAVNDFMLSSKPAGGNSTDDSNYSFILTDQDDRKGR